VLEFNCRFGDPETQSILPRLDGDLLIALAAAAAGDLEGVELAAGPEAAVTVVVASAGYPRTSESGVPIHGVERAEETGALVFHAGTALRGEQLVTSGGRVLAVTATGADVAAARERAYGAVDQIQLEGMQVRRDIAVEPAAVRA
jgi:phosphoribosylamine--glycine ligase